MQAVAERGLWWKFLFDILNVTFVIQWSWRLEGDVLALNEGEHFSLIKK